MPIGQNPVQPTTKAAKYYKSLSLFFLLSFLPRETGADPAQNLTYAQDRVGGGLGAKPPEKFLGTTPFLSWETPIVP